MIKSLAAGFAPFPVLQPVPTVRGARKTVELFATAASVVRLPPDMSWSRLRDCLDLPVDDLLGRFAPVEPCPIPSID